MVDREQLLHLSLSDCDDVLIGGFDSGLVRVWIVAKANLAVLVTQDNKQQHSATATHAMAGQRKNTNQDDDEDNDDDDNDTGDDQIPALADAASVQASMATVTATAIAPLVLATSWQVRHR